MKARILINTGASDCFISSTFVRQHKIQLRLLTEPKTIRMADGTRVQITTGMDITNSISDHTDEETPKGTIRPSKSLYASPILLVRKPNGRLRVCVNYRALNTLIVKDRYPIPLIRETLDKLSKARYFTKLDIVVAFNNLRIREGDEWMTAFITRYSLYEYKVMPFGLYNGPASWYRYMNSLMPEYFDEFVTIYLDGLLIYSADLDEHKQHVRKVLLRLREAGLLVDVDKCEFHI
jgi:hypothetical protein